MGACFEFSSKRSSYPLFPLTKIVQKLSVFSRFARSQSSPDLLKKTRMHFAFHFLFFLFEATFNFLSISAEQLFPRMTLLDHHNQNLNLLTCVK